MVGVWRLWFSSPHQKRLAEGGQTHASAAPGCWLPHRLIIQQAGEQVAGKHEYLDGVPFLGAPSTPCSSCIPFLGSVPGRKELCLCLLDGKTSSSAGDKGWSKRRELGSDLSSRKAHCVLGWYWGAVPGPSCPLPCSCLVPWVNVNLSGGILLKNRNEGYGLVQLWCGDGWSPVGCHCARSTALSTPLLG